MQIPKIILWVVASRGWQHFATAGWGGGFPASPFIMKVSRLLASRGRDSAWLPVEETYLASRGRY